MSQPTQVYTVSLPNQATSGGTQEISQQGYCVIDNSSAPTFPTLNAGTHIGYDTIIDQGINSGQGGNLSQGQNLPSGANGTIPDFVNLQTFSAVLGYAKMVGFKNPA